MSFFFQNQMLKKDSHEFLNLINWLSIQEPTAFSDPCLLMYIFKNFKCFDFFSSVHKL